MPGQVKTVFLWFLLMMMRGGCSNGQHKAEQVKLPATSFAQKIAETRQAQVVDVRTHVGFMDEGGGEGAAEMSLRAFNSKHIKI